MSVAFLRSEFSECVTLTSEGFLTPLEGIGTTIYIVNPDGSLGDTYAPFDDIIGSTAASSMVTDDKGFVSYWLDPGEYKIHFEDTEISSRIPDFYVGFVSNPFTQPIPPPQIGMCWMYIGTDGCPADEDGITRYLAADGSAISCVTYAVLWRKMGSPGAGDTFNLPVIKFGSPDEPIYFMVKVL